MIATSRNPSKTPSLVAEIESNLRGKWLALDVSWPADDIGRAIQTADALELGGDNGDDACGIDAVQQRGVRGTRCRRGPA